MTIPIRILPVQDSVDDPALVFLGEEIARDLNPLGARAFFEPVWEDALPRIVREVLARREQQGGRTQTGTAT